MVIGEGPRALCTGRELYSIDTRFSAANKYGPDVTDVINGQTTFGVRSKTVTNGNYALGILRFQKDVAVVLCQWPTRAKGARPPEGMHALGNDDLFERRATAAYPNIFASGGTALLPRPLRPRYRFNECRSGEVHQDQYLGSAKIVGDSRP